MSEAKRTPTLARRPHARLFRERTIRSLKTLLGKSMVSRDRGRKRATARDWQAVLSDCVSTLNSRPKRVLGGLTPTFADSRDNL